MNAMNASGATKSKGKLCGESLQGLRGAPGVEALAAWP
jgi:hypothetical protein